MKLFYAAALAALAVAAVTVTAILLSAKLSLSICPPVRPSIHPYEFFFRADSGATKWSSGRRNEKKDVQKSDIALVE